MQVSKDPIPLWKQLQACAEVVRAVRQGASGTAAIEAVAVGLRPGVQALTFQVWRNLGRAEALRRLLAPRKPPPPVDALLCVALALGWTDEGAPYDPHTLVNQAAEAAKRTPAMRGAVNFVNACMRRFLRERDTLVTTTNADPVAVWNHPVWWIDRLKSDYPQHWQAILLANNAHAPMTLRVNRQKSSVPAYLALLADAEQRASAVGSVGIVLDAPLPVQRLPGFKDGWVSVQDAAAQMSADLLGDDVTDWTALRVLDACAAPGGKTGHLLELGAYNVLALDVDAQRCQRIHENLNRLGLQAKVVAADAGQPEDWWDGQPFDRILLDAPCSASGIVRRHPDVRWLRRATDIDELATIQQRLLQTLWPLLKPGGRLLYCTCSVFAAEGQEQIQTFLVHNTDARLLPSPGHLLPGKHPINTLVSDNLSGDHDGFFYALLQKLDA